MVVGNGFFVFYCSFKEETKIFITQWELLRFRIKQFTNEHIEELNRFHLLLLLVFLLYYFQSVEVDQSPITCFHYIKMRSQPTRWEAHNIKYTNCVTSLYSNAYEVGWDWFLICFVALFFHHFFEEINDQPKTMRNITTWW